MLNFNFKTDDGLHTVRLEGTVGKYAVWADDDFVKYAYLTSNCWMNEEDVELFGRPGRIIVCEGGPEVFIDGKSLRDGMDYITRKNQIQKAVHYRTTMLFWTGIALIAVFILILFLSSSPLRFSGLPFIGINFLIWAVIRKAKEKKLFC